MPEIPPDVEQHVRDMTDQELSIWLARLRNPDTGESLRSVASAALSGDALDAFLAVTDPSKFVGDDGAVDPAKVGQHLAVMFPHLGISSDSHQPNDFGQRGDLGPSDTLQAGDRGRIAAAERRNRPVDPTLAARARHESLSISAAAAAGEKGWRAPSPTVQQQNPDTSAGAAGRAEAQRRANRREDQR